MVPAPEPFESIAGRADGTSRPLDCFRPWPRLAVHYLRLETPSARRSPDASRYEQLQKGPSSYPSADRLELPLPELGDIGVVLARRCSRRDIAVIVLGDLRLSLPTIIGIVLPGGTIGAQSGGSTVVVSVRSLCDLVAERLTDVDRPRVLVLVHMRQLVHDDRQVGAIRRRHVDAVERREGAALIQLEDEAEHSALVDPDLVPPERVGPQHTLRGRAFGAAERRGVRNDVQHELDQLGSANEVEHADQQRPHPRGTTLGLGPERGGTARGEPQEAARHSALLIPPTALPIPRPMLVTADPTALAAPEKNFPILSKKPRCTGTTRPPVSVAC